MEKIVFMEKLFSKRREKLINKCISLDSMGKSFIYILPSSAGLQHVRKGFFSMGKGYLWPKAIVFDDLEMKIVKDRISHDSIIYSPGDRVMISNICRRLKHKFRYYGGISEKGGMHSEISKFIRILKRSCIDEEKLSHICGNISDEVLKDKLYDLSLVYGTYNEMFHKNNIYDRNDISIKAVELSSTYKALDDIDTVIIDGFTDIEIVSMKLIESIVKAAKVNIYVNCPYRIPFMEDFLYEQIQKPFHDMGFEIVSDDGEPYNIKSGIKELCEKLYSGGRIEASPEEVIIKKYPCIEAEIRGIAQDIEQKIEKGEKRENIAVYINHRNEYSRCTSDIFKEFDILLSMSYVLPLSASEIVREIVKGVGETGENILPLYNWIEKLSSRIKDRKPYMNIIKNENINYKTDPEESFDIQAVDKLYIFARDMRVSFERNGLINENMTKGDFLGLVYDSIKESSITIRQGDAGGVKVLDTALAKGVYYNHVYILGLNEGEVPEIPDTAGLFDRFETEALSQFGIRYNNYSWELNREKIRFNLALSSGLESVNLSYRSADEEGKYAIPSSFIDEVKFISGIQESKSVSMRERFEGSFQDIPNKDVDTLVDNFKEFSKELYTFSPSALNTYANCPFMYMMDYLFEAGEEEEDQEGYSVIEVGNLYHEVLYRYYSSVSQFESLYRELFSQAYEAAFKDLRQIEAAESDLAALRENCFNILRNFITADLNRMKAFEKATGNVLRPYMLEKILENESVFGVNVRSRIDRIDMEYENINGKLLPTGRYIIYDYKKRSIKGLTDVLENKNYQLPIYYHLINDVMSKVFGSYAECMALLYLSIEKTGDTVEKDGIYKTEYKKALGLGSKRSDVKGERFDLLMEYVKGMILDAISSIEGGRFSHKTVCSNFEGYSPSRCRYEGICSYRKNKARVC